MKHILFLLLLLSIGCIAQSKIKFSAELGASYNLTTPSKLAPNWHMSDVGGDNSYFLTGIASYNLCKAFVPSIGMGFSYSIKPIITLPLFADLKINLMKGENRPYLEGFGGYSFIPINSPVTLSIDNKQGAYDGGVLIGGAIGMQLSRYTLSLGYSFQHMSYKDIKTITDPHTPELIVIGYKITKYDISAQMITLKVGIIL